MAWRFPSLTIITNPVTVASADPGAAMSLCAMPYSHPAADTPRMSWVVTPGGTGNSRNVGPQARPIGHRGPTLWHCVDVVAKRRGGRLRELDESEEKEHAAILPLSSRARRS